VFPIRANRLQSSNLVENSSGMCGFMLSLLGCGPREFYPPESGFRMRITPHSRLPGEPIDDVKTCRSASAGKRAVKKVGNVRKEAGKRLGR
jgi:hypothetical protein